MRSEDRHLKTTNILQQSTSDYITQRNHDVLPKNLGIELGNYGHSSVKSTKKDKLDSIQDYNPHLTYKQKQDNLASI